MYDIIVPIIFTGLVAIVIYFSFKHSDRKKIRHHSCK